MRNSQSVAIAQRAFTITPSANALAFTTKGIFVGVTGNITATFADGTSVQFTNVPAGYILPIAATKVTAATATGLVGLA